MDIHNLTVLELAHALSEKQLSPLEVTREYLSMIEEKNGTVNGYIRVMAECALDEAKSAEKRILSGESSPLLGVPYAVKDNIAVEGVPMTAASDMLRDFMPPYTATVVEKLTEAGAVILGKTNMDEFAMGSSCEKSVFGAVHNPIDTTRSAGGSSGGSAAVVAADMAPFSLATDTGGSARQPAAFCNLVSVKPTYGLLSRYGVVPLAPSMDAVCPITKTVSDSAAVLQLMSGRDPRDMTSVESHLDLLTGIDSGVRGKRIAVPRDIDGFCERGEMEALNRAVRELEKLGATVDYIDRNEALSLEMALDVYIVMATSEAASCLARYNGMLYGFSKEPSRCEDWKDIMRTSRSYGFGDEVRRRIIAGQYALSSSYGGGCYTKAKSIRASIIDKMDALMATYDAVLMPTTYGVPFTLGNFDCDPTALYMSDMFTVLSNLSGTPAITVPAGGKEGLPYGVMLVGARFGERELFRCAYALEETLRPYVREEVRL